MNGSREFWIPADHSRQVTAAYYVDRLLASRSATWTVLDLGCGVGRSISRFQSEAGINWVGLDVSGSEEMQAGIKAPGRIAIYNGTHMPFPDRCFDLIYCKQVLGHVREPSRLLTDVSRVLKDGGYFAGSVSCLEPYVSQLRWNFTAFGLASLFEDAGLSLLEARPSIDAFTLIARAGLGRPAFFNRFWDNESPLNRLISLWGKLRHKEAAAVNFAKLLFSGHFCFLARKRGDAV